MIHFLCHRCYFFWQWLSWKAASGFERLLCGVLEDMDRCTGHRDITELLLKKALNTIQSISQFYRKSDGVVAENEFILKL